MFFCELDSNQKPKKAKKRQTNAPPSGIICDMNMNNFDLGLFDFVFNSTKPIVDYKTMKKPDQMFAEFCE